MDTLAFFILALNWYDTADLPENKNIRVRRLQICTMNSMDSFYPHCSPTGGGGYSLKSSKSNQ